MERGMKIGYVTESEMDEESKRIFLRLLKDGSAGEWSTGKEIK